MPQGQAQYAPMAPQGQFNVNQAAAGGLQQAMQGTQQAMQAPINIGAYANPYENQVVQQSMRDVGSAAQMGLNQLDAQAGAAQAFGGSRHGIAQAETMKGFNQQALDQAAQLRSQGFNASLRAAMADRQARLGAASQLGYLGQQAFGVGQTIQSNQRQQGLLQQSIQQALIDAARQQYAGYTGAPQTALQAPLDALGIAQQGGARTTTDSDQPGLLSYLQTGAKIAALCWVAREVYGKDDPKWLQFREWVIGYSPDWFYKAYSKYGENVAKAVSKMPALKAIIRPYMDAKRKAIGFK